MTDETKNWVIVLAAGKGNRFGADKMFIDYLGAPLIRTTLSTVKQVCNNIILVVNEAKREKFISLFGDEVIYVNGGQTRTESVLNALNALPSCAQFVAIHDGARPFASANLFIKLFKEAEEKGNAIPIVPLSGTAYAITDKIIPLCRSAITLVQTPQVFDVKKIKEAYDLHNKATTDDSQIYFNRFNSLNFVEGERNNQKITYQQDLTEYRTGIGFDAHRLGENRNLVLCGEKIPFALGLIGHSDADVPVHALIDALLSASGQKDIGSLFPDSDDNYKDISSLVLLKKTLELCQQLGFSVVNVSIAIMAQEPKLAPFIDKMRKNLCAVLKVPLSQINISATTTENLGITAKGEGIASQAVVLLKK